MNGVEQNVVPVSFPVVDVENIFQRENITEEHYLKIGKEILKSFEDHGYVYLQSFGILEEMFATATEKMEMFYNLDEETKMKYQRNLLTMHGYSNERLEIPQVPKNDSQESIDTAGAGSAEKPQANKTQNAMNLKDSCAEEPQAGRETFDFWTGVDYFPREVPGLGEVVSSLFTQLCPRIEKIMKSVGLALGDSGHIVTDGHDDVNSDRVVGVRIARYIPVENENKCHLRFKEHIDIGLTLTIQLYQSTQGLQVKNRNGIWQDIKLPMDSVLMFPDQIFQILTGDKIPATLHRVAVHESTPDREKPRFSILSFIRPKEDALIKPVDGSDNYAPVFYKDILKSVATKLSNAADIKNYEELQ